MDYDNDDLAELPVDSKLIEHKSLWANKMFILKTKSIDIGTVDNFKRDTDKLIVIWIFRIYISCFLIISLNMFDFIEWNWFGSSTNT